jgi:hypothetical protein
MPVRIELQTTVTPFDASFLEFLPVVEKAMIDHGLNPRDFIIAKDATQFNSYPGLRQRFHSYTVFVRGKNFTVLQPTDRRFSNISTTGVLPRRRSLPRPSISCKELSGVCCIGSINR